PCERANLTPTATGGAASVVGTRRTGSPVGIGAERKGSGAGNASRLKPRTLGRDGNGDKARPATGLGGHLLDLSEGIARGKREDHRKMRKGHPGLRTSSSAD